MKYNRLRQVQTVSVCLSVRDVACKVCVCVCVCVLWCGACSLQLGEEYQTTDRVFELC